jgi:hypothetical protein
MIVMVFGGLSLFILGGTLTWTSNNAHLNERHNQYLEALAAAEAATEKVLAELAVDFRGQGPAVVAGKAPVYRNRVPRAVDNHLFGRYRFNNGRGQSHQTYVEMIHPWGVAPLISQYRGLSGFAATYRIVSNARPIDTRHELAGAVLQEVQIATIPIFQFAIFYNLDLEINPGPNMTVNGRVHSNGNIYSQPHAQLRFLGDVTAAGQIIHDKMPGDPLVRRGGSITYEGESDSGVNSLHLPLGTDNTPEAVRQIVEMPPVNEPPNSAMARQRLYNNADLIIRVYDTQVVAHGGVANGNGPALQWSTVSGFVRTNASFFNRREGKTVRVTELDVGKLAEWNSNHNPLRMALGRDVSSVYIVDLRTQTIDTQPGIRLVNGQHLPPLGLTVATPQPLYVQGHYNAPAPGSSDTSLTKPAALIADAVTILSPNWDDARSTQSLNSRTAVHTTVNAAMLAGIVPTTPGSYSGGVENFPRFLEDWRHRTLTYSGSMIVMYASEVATAPWVGTGTIYNPPVRNWNFDMNFLDPTRLPPATPAVRTTIRGRWEILPPDTTS